MATPLRHTCTQMHIFALMFMHSFTQIHALCRHISTGMDPHACRLSLLVAHTYCLSHTYMHTHTVSPTSLHTHILSQTHMCMHTSLFQADACTHMLSLADTHTHTSLNRPEQSPESLVGPLPPTRTANFILTPMPLIDYQVRKEINPVKSEPDRTCLLCS